MFSINPTKFKFNSPNINFCQKPSIKLNLLPSIQKKDISYSFIRSSINSILNLFHSRPPIQNTGRLGERNTPVNDYTQLSNHTKHLQHQNPLKDYEIEILVSPRNFCVYSERATRKKTSGSLEALMLKDQNGKISFVNNHSLVIPTKKSMVIAEILSYPRKVETLEQKLEKTSTGKFSLEQTRKYGFMLASQILKLHDQGMTHGWMIKAQDVLLSDCTEDYRASIKEIRYPCQKDRASAMADYESLGVILFRMYTGTHYYRQTYGFHQSAIIGQEDGREIMHRPGLKPEELMLHTLLFDPKKGLISNPAGIRNPDEDILGHPFFQLGFFHEMKSNLRSQI